MKSRTFQRLQGGKIELGLFEVKNDSSEVVVLDGFRKNGKFYIWYPEVSLQFEDKNGWEDFLYPAGSFSKPTDTLEIKVGGLAEFFTKIESNPIDEKSEHRLRIIVNTHNPDSCVISQAFSAH